jgi:hypothetical protein
MMNFLCVEVLDHLQEIGLFETYHAYKNEAERKERKDVREKSNPQ